MPKSAFPVLRLSSLPIWMTLMEKASLCCHFPNRYRISVYYCMFASVLRKQNDSVEFFLKAKEETSFYVLFFWRQTHHTLNCIILKQRVMRRWSLTWETEATYYPDVWNKAIPRKSTPLKKLGCCCFLVVLFLSVCLLLLLLFCFVLILSGVNSVVLSWKDLPFKACISMLKVTILLIFVVFSVHC